MLIFLPVISFFLLCLIFFQKTALKRESFLFSTLIWGGLIFASTEFLNIFKLITFGGILSFWILTTTALSTFLFYLFKRNPITIPKTENKPSLLEIIWGIGILCIIVITGLICFKSPPNNWDSMTYHLGRVVHWMQNKSVEHYPTSITNQIWKKPLAEYIILHLNILSKGDYFSNFVQWFSLIGCLFSTSLIAQKLGASRQGQIITAIISATIPMGILQATSTQNDYVTAYWMTCFIYSVIAFLKSNERKYIFSMSLSLALSLYTKETTFIYATPFLAWLTVRGFVQYKLNFLKTALIMACFVLIINFPQAKRNFNTFGNIISPQQVKSTVKNTLFTPNALASNLIRYTSLQFGSMNEELNAFTEGIIKKIHTFLKIDINDPRTTMIDFVVPRDIRHEDNSSNLLHLILIFFACFQYVFNKKLRQNPLLKEYFWICLATALLFIFFLKWTLFRNRLLLPIAIFFAPAIGIALANLGRKKMIFASILPIILAFPWLLYNQTRPLIGKATVFNMTRKQQYFSNRPYFIPPYYSITDIVKSKNCYNIGFQMGEDSWEYPFWKLIEKENEEIPKKLRFEHVLLPTNSSLKSINYPLGEFTPCIIISENKNNQHKLVLNDNIYVYTARFSHLSIYEYDPNRIIIKTNLFNHFVNTIQEFNTTNLIRQKSPNAQMTILQKRVTTLQEAQLVDLEELTGIYPNLANQFETNLITGLNQILYGYQYANKEYFLKGQKRLEKWEEWFEKNKDAIAKALLRYTKKI